MLVSVLWCNNGVCDGGDIVFRLTPFTLHQTFSRDNRRFCAVTVALEIEVI